MYVVVGTGTAVELRRIAGLGSIILDHPLEYPHPSGAPIRVYAVSPKSLANVNRVMAMEFSRAWLVEELLPRVVDQVTPPHPPALSLQPLASCLHPPPPSCLQP